MKKLIQNLLIPFAVVAMLTVGVFTMNASEKTGNAVEIEKVEPVKAENPYEGKVFYRYLDSSTNEYIYVELSSIEKGECTLSNESNIRCTAIVEGMTQNLWGKDQFGNYTELYHDITE